MATKRRVAKRRTVKRVAKRRVVKPRIEWGGHRRERKRLSWTRFAELMDSLAYGD